MTSFGSRIGYRLEHSDQVLSDRVCFDSSIQSEVCISFNFSFLSAIQDCSYIKRCAAFNQSIYLFKIDFGVFLNFLFDKLILSPDFMAICTYLYFLTITTNSPLYSIFYVSIYVL